MGWTDCLLYLSRRWPWLSGERLSDLAKDEPRLAGRQANDFLDSRFLRELEASGFLPQVMSGTR
jgi:hypothetical protein